MTKDSTGTNLVEWLRHTLGQSARATRIYIFVVSEALEAKIRRVTQQRRLVNLTCQSSKTCLVSYIIT